MEHVSLEQAITDAAGRIGLSGIGFSRADEIPSQRLDEWLRRSYQGKMSYLERNVERRLDPRQILPEVQSIISVTLNYFWEYLLPYDNPLEGIVSRYAQGRNYHRLMEEKLKELLAAIQEIEPSAEGRIYVDTGPVLEKEWAARSGLGWIGKHTNLIDGKKGSWFFLGEILTNLDLRPGSPVPDHCGSCTSCIEACPTDAIVEPYVLDARRCISYLTIELREDIPLRLRPQMGNLIFGCDICQDVCPWNRDPQMSVVADFQRSEASWNLKELSRLSPDEFSRRFRGSPIKRSKWRGFMRNVAVAMGNSRSDEFVDDLKRLALAEDELVQRHALWALDRLGSDKAREALRELKQDVSKADTMY